MGGKGLVIDLACYDPEESFYLRQRYGTVVAWLWVCLLPQSVSWCVDAIETYQGSSLIRPYIMIGKSPAVSWVSSSGL